MLYDVVSCGTKLWRSSLIFAVQITSLNNQKYSPAIYCSTAVKCRLNVFNHSSGALKVEAAFLGTVVKLLVYCTVPRFVRQHTSLSPPRERAASLNLVGILLVVRF